MTAFVVVVDVHSWVRTGYHLHRKVPFAVLHSTRSCMSDWNPIRLNNFPGANVHSAAGDHMVHGAE